MRKIFTFLALLSMMVCASGYAANYFVTGTVWEYSEFNQGADYLSTVELVDAVGPDGEQCYQMVKKSVETDFSGNPISDEVETTKGWLVKVDGEKVFLCSSKESEPQWQLVYDFSLQPGEGCLIKETPFFSDDILKEVYFKYTGMTKIKHYDVEVMELKVFWSEEESGDDSNAISTEYWIPGVGSIVRFDGLYRYLSPGEEPVQCDYGCILMKVSDAEGNVIVEYRDQSGIAAVEAEDSDEPAAYYNLQGMRVNNPSGGVFIRVEGGKTSKVVLR